MPMAASSLATSGSQARLLLPGQHCCDAAPGVALLMHSSTPATGRWQYGSGPFVLVLSRTHHPVPIPSLPAAPAELKKALAVVGVASEFQGGALYCAGGVVVRRAGEEGGLLVEGPLSEGYYHIRDVVYGQYHVC